MIGSTGRVNVHLPRNLLAGLDELAGIGPILVVALADRPFHQLRARVDQAVHDLQTGAAAGAGVDVVGLIGVQHPIRDDVVHDLARRAPSTAGSRRP